MFTGMDRNAIPASDDDMITYAQVARIWDIQTHTARVWVHKGDPRLPPPLKYSKSFVRFRRGDVLERLAALRAGTLLPFKSA